MIKGRRLYRPAIQQLVSDHANKINGLKVAETEGFEPSIPLWGMLI